MDRPEEFYLSAISDIGFTADEIVLWARAVAYCNFGNLANEKDRTEILAFAMATAEFCIKNGHSLKTYFEILKFADCPRPE